MPSPTPGTKENAVKYNRLKVKFRLAGIAFTALYLLFFQALLSRWLEESALGFSGQFYIALILYLAGFGVVYYIVDFPLSLAGGFLLERRFSLSSISFANWLKDNLKASVISSIFFAFFILALYFLLRSAPRAWWYLITVFYFFATIFMARIGPLILIPLFFKYSPVEEGLKKDIIELSKKCDIKLLNVYKINFSSKTKKLNAALTGLGKSRRVILADNLIREFSNDEIKGVLAHEFAHHKYMHIWKLLLFGFLATGISFYFLFLASPNIARVLNANAIYDIRLLPAYLFVLFLISLVIMPIQNWFSRILEREADAFALKITADKDTFISLMQKLGDYNLADPNPPKLVKIIFYSHPPISERIEFAKAFKT
ncbi:MAG: M48 family metallopeptidase [Candidatus Omnitrophica bacterium]|nr:M48 family metallopeptidase [Candidatus Omnitrophota bacterium]